MSLSSTEFIGELANRHTAIETETDLNIMGNILKAGKYSLFTVPGNDSWDITFNSTNAYFGIKRPNNENDIYCHYSPKFT